MERKLVKQGRNALTVTLPAAWVKEKGLKAGNSVDIMERNKEIVISTRLTTARKELTLDLRGCERSMMYHILQGKYIEGYDTIEFMHTNPKIAQEVVQSLLGMVIEEHKQTRTVYKSIVAVPEENFDAVFRRAAHILLQQVRTLERVANKKASLDDVKSEEKLLDYNLLYCLRYLNKYENREHAYKYFLLCSTIESVGDQITDIAARIGNRKELAKNVVKGVEEYIKYLFAKDFKKMYLSLRAFRNRLNQKTFVDGLAFSLAETLYNYIGYLAEADE
jgi:phosphate uptake regulator